MSAPTAATLAALSDEEFAEYRVAVLVEMERREALSSIPQRIAEQAAHFRAIGGSEDDLAAALAPTPAAPVEE